MLIYESSAVRIHYRDILPPYFFAQLKSRRRRTKHIASDFS